MRYSIVVVLASSLAFACSGSKKKLPVGSTCNDSEECSAGLCLAGVCLDPESDEDRDSLTNRIEGSLGTDPFASDSDGDGVADPDELEADLSPRDGDGDGTPDALESRTEDADHDCLSDEDDDDDEAPNRGDKALVPLVEATCPAPAGVCAAAGATLAVSCPADLAHPFCDYSEVPGHEADETLCDTLDNDCDGATDEPAACAPDIDPIDVGLIGHWPLDGDGADVGPHGDDGVVSGATPVADRFGAAGKALRFAATRDRVTVASTHHPLGEVTVTYSAWVRPDADGGAATGILAFGDVLVPQARSALVTWGPRSCLEYTGEQNDFGAPTACTPDGAWSFVAVVKSGRHVKLYLNGRLQREGELAEGQDVVSTHLEIGLSKDDAGGDVYEQFRGDIDDVRAWSRALSDAELDGLYHAGGWADVGTGDNPGASCLHVRDGGRPTGSGRYWLDPTQSGTPIQAYCDMDLDGGGWTLVWAYDFTAAGGFNDRANAVTPAPTWRGENIDVPRSTTPPADPETPGAIDWALWAGLGNELLVRADYVDTIACTPGRPLSGSLVDGLSGQVDCRVVEERTSRCDGTLPGWLGWDATGPALFASSLFLYWDGATDLNWPTHDACGTNVPPADTSGASGGALYLRPSDVAVALPAVCRFVPSEDRRTSTHRIDPDGPGGAAPFEAECDFSRERGGWTRLSPDLHAAMQRAGDIPREYLFARGDAWYRSPVTTATWSWSTFAEVAGTWVHDGPGGPGAFECAGGDAGGWGVGCGTSGAERVLPGAGAGAVKDEAAGTTTLCQAPPDAFRIGGQGCADDASVWVRPTGCMPDVGSLLGDGDFTGWATREPDDPPGCWGVYGPDGTMVADPDEVPPGGDGPSLRATNPELGNDIWALIVNQQGLTFVAGRAYRLGFWAKAAEARAIRVFLQTRDLSHAFYWEDVDLGTEWRFYELSFVADVTSYDAMLDFQLAELSTAAVWLDGVVLADVGESPCVPAGNDLVADGGFAAGRTCWRFGHDVTGVRATTWSDPEDAPSAAARPSMRVEQASEGDVVVDPWRVTLVQDGMTLSANRHYRLSFSARAGAARDLFVMLQGGPDDGLFHGFDERLGTGWQSFEHDFVTTVASSPGEARIELQLGGPSGVPVWIDDVSLVDVGASPCAPTGGNLVGDGGFAAGTACWQFGWNQATLTASARAVDVEAQAGHAPALEVAHAPGTDQVHEVSLRQAGKTITAGRWYRLSYWARSAAPRTLRAAVWYDGGTYTYNEPDVDGTWRRYVHDFRASETHSDVAVELHLAEPGGATVWLDDVRLEDMGADPCASNDPGSLVADGGFGAGVLCWELGWNGDLIDAQATSDTAGAATGLAPALAVTQTAGATEVYHVSLRQPGKTLAAGRWYRLSYWAKAASPRPAIAAVWRDGETFTYSVDALGTTWRQYVHAFRTLAAASEVAVEFHLGDASAATVWLDDVRLEDQGVDPCAAPPAGNLVADGGFEAGAMCWGFGFDGSATTATATPDSDVAPGGDAPSLRFTQSPGVAEVHQVGTYQGGITIEAGRWYRLTFRARAAAARPIIAAVWDDVTAFLYRSPTIGTTWASYSFDFAPEVGSAAGMTGVSFQLGDPGGATVWLDDVVLEELGPSPCVATAPEVIEDGELAAGMLCWFEPSPDGRYELSSDHPAATEPPSLAITNLVPDNELWEVQLIQRGFSLVAGRTYRLSFWARAAAPRTIVALVHNWDTSTSFTYQVVSLGTQWQAHVFDFTATATEDNVLVEFQIGDSSTETVWIDGVSLRGLTAAPPTAGLVAYFPFGGNADDQSGTGNDGVVSGATTTADRHGNPIGAYQFDGVDDHVVAGTDGFSFGGEDRTVAFWLKPDTAGPGCGSTGSSVVVYGDGDCSGKMFGAGYCAQSWYFWGGCMDASPGASDPAYQAITPGQWSFIAMRLASGVLTVRVDDIAMDYDRGTLATQVGDLYIGAETVNGGASFRSGFDGAVDDVRVYDRALDDAELDALREEGAPAVP